MRRISLALIAATLTGCCTFQPTNTDVDNPQPFRFECRLNPGWTLSLRAGP